MLKLLFPKSKRSIEGTGKRQALQFKISEHSLLLNLPTERISKDMPPTKLVQEVDLYAKDTFGEFNSVILMQCLFDFPRRFFWQPDFGSMLFKVSVHRAKRGGGDMRKWQDMKEEVRQSLHEAYDDYNKKVWDEGVAVGKLSVDIVDDQYSFPAHSDENFYKKNIDNKDWLMYVIVGVEGHEVFNIHLDKNHYLCLDFEYMGGSKSSKSQVLKLFRIDTDYIKAHLKLNYGSYVTALEKGIEIPH